LPPGTTNYSHGYTECQRNGTGGNLSGRYFAARSTIVLTGTDSERLHGEAAAKADMQNVQRYDAPRSMHHMHQHPQRYGLSLARRSIDTDSNALGARG